MHAEVIRFVTTPESYTIYIEPSLRLDVARCNPVEAPDNAGELGNWSYLWVQALQGFYVLRQPSIGTDPLCRLKPWIAVLQITPAEFSSSFFSWLEEHFFALLGPSLLALPPEEVPEETLEKEDPGAQ